jgi:hypothetical protein
MFRIEQIYPHDFRYSPPSRRRFLYRQPIARMVEMTDMIQKEYEKRLLVVWQALAARLPAMMSHEQLHRAFAHYAYGMTLPLHAEGKPADQLAAIVDLMGKAMAAESVDQAIHSKETCDEQFSSTCESLVRLGERDALAIIKTNQSNSHSPLSSTPSPAHDAPVGAGDREGAI